MFGLSFGSEVCCAKVYSIINNTRYFTIDTAHIRHNVDCTSFIPLFLDFLLITGIYSPLQLQLCGRTESQTPGVPQSLVMGDLIITTYQVYIYDLKPVVDEHAYTTQRAYTTYASSRSLNGPMKQRRSNPRQPIAGSVRIPTFSVAIEIVAGCSFWAIRRKRLMDYPAQ